MELTDAQQKMFIDYLGQRWQKVSHLCPICGKQLWQIADKIFEIQEYGPPEPPFGGMRIPVIPVTCENCGYTLLFNAIIAGLVTAIKKESKNE